VRVDAAELSGLTPAYAQVLECIVSGDENLPRTKTDVRQLTQLSERQVHYAVKYLLESGDIIKHGRRGRAETYKGARVQKGANSSAGGGVQRVHHPIGIAPFPVAPFPSPKGANRFGPEALGSPALTAYADLEPQVVIQ
jgi:hypothetical protein